MRAFRIIYYALSSRRPYRLPDGQICEKRHFWVASHLPDTRGLFSQKSPCIHTMWSTVWLLGSPFATWHPVDATNWNGCVQAPNPGFVVTEHRFPLERTIQNGIATESRIPDLPPKIPWERGECLGHGITNWRDMSQMPPISEYMGIPSRSCVNNKEKWGRRHWATSSRGYFLL